MNKNQNISKGCRLVALVLVFAMLCSMGVWADDTFKGSDNASYTLHTKSTLKVPYGSTSPLLTIESYITSEGNEEKTVKPCDIIFVLDQSRFVNGTNGTERAAILNAMDELLENLEKPTYGEHRIAIAGYGRVNVAGNLDSYNATSYPGTRQSGSNYSLNTGYYTTSGFVSSKGWAEVKDSNSEELPTMPTSYQKNMTYSSAFMSVDEAEKVIDPDTMLAWYSGASRMDAGLTIAKQLATVATDYAKDQQEDRNLIVCVVASSLPIQNFNNYNCIRTSAVKAAASTLKGMGATIFALGDYHNAGKGLTTDSRNNFETTMTSICGVQNTDDKDDEKEYFYPMSGTGNATDALNKMVTNITQLVAGNTVQTVTITVNSTDIIDNRTDKSQSVTDWISSLDGDELATVSFVPYKYIYYEEYDWGCVDFDDSAAAETSVPISNLRQEDGTIQYTATLAPVMGENATDEISGAKVVITISAPVTVNYAWSGDIPAGLAVPASEKKTKGSTTMPATPSVDDPRYRFDGWFLDAAGTIPADSASSTDDSYTIYGHWTKLCIVQYHEELKHTENEAIDESITLEKGTALTTYTPQKTEHKFLGWYTDTSFKTPFTDRTAVTEDLDLYAKWVSTQDVPYSVIYYQQNANDNGYTEIFDDTEYNLGTIGDTVTVSEKSYTGFTYSHTTYETLDKPAQVTALTIQADGSLVVNVYYDRTTHQVTYNLNGGESTEGDSNDTVRYGATITTKAAPTKTGYHFTGWKLGDAIYQSNKTFTVTADAEFVAQWEINTYTVVFDANGGTGEMASQGFTYGQEQALTANSFTRSGYTFAGWNTQQDGNGTTYTGQASVSNLTEENSRTVTMYAQWSANTDTTYTVEYYQQNVTGADYTKVDTENRTGTTGAQIGEITKTYTGFTRKTTTYTATGVAASTDALPIQGDGSLVVKVYYDRNTYTVKYDLDGGTGAADENYGDQTVRYGSEVSLATAPTKTGYTFSGWRDGTTTHEAGQVITINNDVPLTAQWTPNSYTVTFDANIGDVTGTMDAQTFTYDTAQSLTKNAYSCVDYAFIGWNTQADGTGTTYEDQANVENLTDEADGNVILYAQWLPKLTVIDPETVSAMYKVEHYAETLDGTYVLEDTDIKFGTIDATVTAEVRSYEHYAADTKRSTLDGTVTMPAIDTNGAVQVLTLQVYYDLDTCSLSYDLSGGTGAENISYDSEAIRYGDTVAAKAAPTRFGYGFQGWKDEQGNTYQPGDNISVTDAVTLTAQWVSVITPADTPSVSPSTEPTDTPADTEDTEDPPETTVSSTVSQRLETQNHIAYIKGYPDGTVGPNDSITRSQVAAIFFRLLKEEVREEYRTTENSFMDVSQNAWYCEEVSTLAAMGILNGRTTTTFDPDAPITRAELAVICARFDTGDAEGTNPFSDIQGHWAQSEIQRAAALGWVLGYEDGTFRPDNYITRAEAMTLINRVLDRTPESEEQFPENMITWPDNQDNGKWYYLAVQEATNTYETKKIITG